jgi:hypothetical protein
VSSVKVRHAIVRRAMESSIEPVPEVRAPTSVARERPAANAGKQPAGAAEASV